MKMHMQYYKQKPRINKKIMESLWFDPDHGFCFSNDRGRETFTGWECSFTYNILHSEVSNIINSIQEYLEPKSENEIIIFLKFNEETNEITGKYASLRSKYDNENVDRLFHKIEDKFNESIRDLNCGYSIEF